MDERLTNDDIARNLAAARENIRQAAARAGRSENDVKLLLATKTVDAEHINFAISQGVRYIGENRVQELLEKYDKLCLDGAELHFIGRLQSNKVKYIIDKVSMIHSVDSLRLAEEIERQAAKHDTVMKVLVEVNIGDEESKGGVLPEEAEDFCRRLSELRHLHVCGLMAIPPKNTFVPIKNENGGCSEKIYTNQEFFKKILQLFLDISAKKIDNIDMYELSIGMSDDYVCAVENGSTVVRLGRAVFGSRA